MITLTCTAGLQRAIDLLRTRLPMEGLRPGWDKIGRSALSFRWEFPMGGVLDVTLSYEITRSNDVPRLVPRVYTSASIGSTWASAAVEFAEQVLHISRLMRSTYDDLCTYTFEPDPDDVPAPAPKPCPPALVAKAEARLAARLTKPQRKELEALARERQRTYGCSRARVQNSLHSLGLVRFCEEDGSTRNNISVAEIAASYGNLYPCCEITEKGRRVLAQPAPGRRRT